MKIFSKAFGSHQRIPKKYTGEGEDVSPPISLDDIPNGTQSLVIIMDDPDAPMGTFDHWIAWNIDPETKILDEGAEVPIQGKNHFKEQRYRGPMPPPGPVHRYFFKAYALDSNLELPKGSSKKDVEEAMEGHILGHAELIGTYQR